MVSPERQVADLNYFRILDSLKKVAMGNHTLKEKAFILFSIAQVFVCLKRHFNALTWIDHAIALDPENAAYWLFKGDILMAEPFSRYTDSLNAYHSAAALQPDNSAILVRIGNVHEMCNNLDAAIAAYDRALALNPSDAGIWCRKGCALNMLLSHLKRRQQIRILSQDITGDITLLNKVLLAFRRAVDLEPENPEALYLMAQTLAQMEKYDEALRYYDIALQNIRSESSPPLQIWYAKAEVLEKVGRISEAGELFERYHEALKKDYRLFHAGRSPRSL